MLKRPSSRRKTSAEGIQLNLVPILDTMVTLIGFLLFSMSFLAVVNIESVVPQASPKNVQEKLKEKPLQLTVSFRENEAEVWSPFEKIAAKHVPNATAGVPDFKAIHDALVAVKQKFPQETKVVIVPTPGTTYDNLIAAMDTMRTIDAGDPPIYIKDEKTGNDVPSKFLFPEVIFGNLLGDS
ncbi:MAG: biopolymer transporter ExbD [Bdellovibrionota bacterium]